MHGLDVYCAIYAVGFLIGSARYSPRFIFCIQFAYFCSVRCRCRAVAMSIHFSCNCRSVAMHIFMEAMGSLLALGFSSRSLPQVKPSLPYTGIVCGKFNLPIRASSRSIQSEMRLPLLFHFLKSSLPPSIYGTLLRISQYELMENLDK